MWDVDTAFGLTEKSDDLVRKYPAETLELMAVSVSDEQKHAIFHLGRILSIISRAKADLIGDVNFRRLTMFVPEDELKLLKLN